MAKTTKHESGLTYVSFGLLAPNHDLINSFVRKHRRDEKEGKILRFSLARHGWDVDLGGICAVFGEDSPIFSHYEKWIEECVAIRTRQLKALLAGDLPEEFERFVGPWSKVGVVLEGFRAAYCNGKGEIIRPRFVPNTGNGRMEEYFESQLMRSLGWTEPGKGDSTQITHPATPAVWTIPCHISRYEREEDRIRAQVKENNKAEGMVKMSATDNLRASHALLELGVSPQIVRNEFPGTVGQRNVNLWEINAEWQGTATNPVHLFPGEDPRPDLKIIDRMLANPPKEGEIVDSESGWIDVTKGNTVVELVKLRDRSSAELLEKRNRKGKETLSPATAEEVNKFFVGEKPPTPKTLKVAEWSTIKNKPNKVLQEVANAHLSNSTQTPGMALLMDNNNAKVFNEVYLLLEKKVDAKLVLAALQCIKDPSFAAYSSAVLSGEKVIVTVAEPASEPASEPTA